MQQNIKVLIVDDSAVIRRIFTEQLSRQKGIDVVGTAPDPYVARDKIVRLKPDVVTLDIEMPRMDGITFLKKIMKYYPLPVIIVSSLSAKGSQVAMEALSCGAVDVISKPDSAYSVGDMGLQLAEKIRAAACAKIEIPRTAFPGITGKAAPRFRATAKNADKIIAIGASTGGTKAVESILTQLPPDAPGILVVQHMPAKFTCSFSQRLDQMCHLRVKEAEHRDTVTNGLVLVAPGNFHMVLKRHRTRYYVEIKEGPLIHYQRPAIDVTFKSVARAAGARSLGILLTGMGRDGAAGMKEMKAAGAVTIAQDEKSSVVYGMPKEAVRMGAVNYVENIRQMPERVRSILKKL